MALQYDAESNSFWGDSHYSNCLAQIMWHITNQCQLNCKFCFSKFLRYDTTVLTSDIVDSNIALFKRLGVLKLDISGGEPLLVHELPYIADACQNAGIAITLTTSGMGHPENLEWLMGNWHKFSRVIMSLDGPENIHNTLRGNRLAYQKFISLYHSLKKSGCDRLRINTVITKQVLDAGDAIIKLILLLKPQEWCCIEPHPANKTESFDEVAVSYTDFEKFTDKCRMGISNTSTQFIMRTKKDYSSYWTLYPNQVICHLSEMDHFAYFVCFNEENIFAIKKNVSQYPQYCIKIRKGLNYGKAE